MRSLFIFLSIALVTTHIQADNFRVNEESIDFDALYHQIDEAISQSSVYVTVREQKIDTYRDSLMRAKTAEQKILYAEQLFQLYKSFMNDSATHYAEVCINLAESLHRKDLIGRFRSLLAYQCSNTDRYTEALDELNKVDRQALDSTGLVAYYCAWMHVYGELGNYSTRKKIRQHYFDLQNLYRDSVLMVSEEGSEEWLHLKMDILTAQRKFQDALAISNRWLHIVTEGTHESAFAAFYRSVCHDYLQNHDQTCYWLGRSAIDDIKCAVMNQASLLFLAEHLAEDGDIERARRYMDFAMDCNLTFYPRMRTYQTSSVINIIEKSNQAAQSRAKTLLIISGVIIVFLIVIIIALLFTKRKKRLSS